MQIANNAKKLHLYSKPLIVSLKHSIILAKERDWEPKYIFPYLGTTLKNAQTESEFNW